MKVEAQANNQSALRNIAKLLMNSMYGRFGMHVDNTRAQILTHGQATAILNSYVVTNVIPLGRIGTY